MLADIKQLLNCQHIFTVLGSNGQGCVPDHRLEVLSEDEEPKRDVLVLWATDRKASYHGDASAAINCVHEFWDITPCS
jgi:hypothetical protein